MANLVQNATPVAYLASFNQPLSVTAVTQLQTFTFIQQLTYNGILSYLAQNFLGLEDWYMQMSMYSSTNPLLQSAWQTIQSIALDNMELQPDMYVDPTLGQVGTAFLQIPSFGQVFTVTPGDTVSSVSSKIGGQ